MKTPFFLIFSVLSCTLFAQDVRLITFSNSECDESIDLSEVQAKITNLSLNRDTLTIVFSTVANCAGIYEAEAMINNDTLNINYSEGYIEQVTMETGEIREMISKVTCDCCFEFYFSIVGLDKIPTTIKINDEIFK